MSTLLQYFERTVKGLETFFSLDKTVVILLVVLLVLWLGEKKEHNEENNRLLVYTAGVSFLLLFPFTAVFAVIYQSAFYDYEWVWSMVPVVAVIGYGGVLLYESGIQEKKGKLLWWLALLMLLFFCGNQGQLKTATDAEKQNDIWTEGIIAVAETVSKETEPILWGPQNIMQEVRRKTGEIVLIYGKDMWDLKAGAYDYEAYPQEWIQAYEWMDAINVLAAETGEQADATLYEKYEIEDSLPEVFTTMLNSGVNVIVLPESIATNLEEMILQELKKTEKSIQKEYVKQYTVYLLK